MHAAGVLRHVAADRTGDLRGRVGGVVQAVGRRRLGDGQVAHARLDAGKAAGGVHLDDPVEARHHQQDAFLQRQGAAGQAGAGAARHHRHLAGMAQPEQRLDLLDALGQHHQQRHGAVGGEAVALVGFQVFGTVEDFQVGQGRAQFGKQGDLVHFGQCAIDALVVEDVHKAHSSVMLLFLAFGVRRSDSLSRRQAEVAAGDFFASTRVRTGPTSFSVVFTLGCLEMPCSGEYGVSQWSRDQ
ncbi:hypothetical protein D9M70_489960 [compost metagenome]